MSPTEPAGQPLVIVLLGPTASGKTDLAIALAQALDLAVLNVDSRQLYRQMDVGTAKPTAAQRDQARHELLDLRDPDQPINLQEFRSIAEAQLKAELARKPLALLAGGSGLYLQALTQGLEPQRCHPNPSYAPSWQTSASPSATSCCARATRRPPPESPPPMPCAPKGPWRFFMPQGEPSPASKEPRRRPGGCWSWG